MLATAGVDVGALLDQALAGKPAAHGGPRRRPRLAPRRNRTGTASQDALERAALRRAAAGLDTEAEAELMVMAYPPSSAQGMGPPR